MARIPAAAKIPAYKKFGMKSTLVAGDFLFIKAFEFAGKFDETVVQWTADACTLLTEGEILQSHFNRNRAVTLDDYIEIVKRKTASLFHTGTKVGAYLAGASQAIIDETERYGLNMGIAFQMVDDILDVVGHPGSARQADRHGPARWQSGVADHSSASNMATHQSAQHLIAANRRKSKSTAAFKRSKTGRPSQKPKRLAKTMPHRSA